jgi:hypothetical protein
MFIVDSSILAGPICAKRREKDIFRFDSKSSRLEDVC